MAKEFSRSNRIAEQMRRELADLLQFEVKDPRVGMVTVTEVEVTGDMEMQRFFTAHRRAHLSCRLVWRNPQAFCVRKLLNACCYVKCRNCILSMIHPSITA